MAGIVFGCIVPHPPLLVPDIGRGQENIISATTKAMEELTDMLAQQHPQTVLVMSPHGNDLPNAMGILTAASSEGNLSTWGSQQRRHYFNNDLTMVELIQKETGSNNIPIDSIGKSSYKLDHGVMVPMHFLHRAIEGVPLVPLTFSMLPLETHFAFGKAIGRAAELSQKSVAFVASGDLSHRLIPEAPAGYHPMGKIFDEKLVKALSCLDIEAILNMDKELIEQAGECGLRSFVTLLGALDGLKIKPEILSYEGPFGVGYLVASFESIS